MPFIITKTDFLVKDEKTKYIMPVEVKTSRVDKKL